MNRQQFLITGATGAGALLLEGMAPVLTLGAGEFTFGNGFVRATWSTNDGRLRTVRLEDRLNGAAIGLPRELFSVATKSGTVYKASEFTIVSGPANETLSPDPRAARYADLLPGRAVRVELAHPSGALRATWRAIQRNGSHYLRQEVTLRAVNAPLDVSGVKLIDFPELAGAQVVGYVDGSPLVAGNLFLGLEHPFAQSSAIYHSASATLPQRVPLRPGVPLTASAVIGTSRGGQLRRQFLAYLERERAHPYRTFLHYNSWYDIGTFGRYTAAECLDRIHRFGGALHRQRGVKLESFLFDDGWDDPNELWHFNTGFPDGFAPLKAAAAQYGAAPGAWLSPWGGYGPPREERLAAAKRDGYGTNENGLALSAPKYYDLFHDVVMRFIERGGCNQFKLDGTGTASTVYPGSQFSSDFAAAINLIEQMRQAEPSVYVNLTTGTYPSPFWLKYCDSIWRGGDDHNFAGHGSWRQQWITYRDADTYVGIVTQGPLYPLNSLMLHGLIYANGAKPLNEDPGGDFRDCIHAYFGNGTQLQEMYITPTLLSEQNWNDLAQAAKWSAANADVLKDTHWIGGDPYRLEIYGWAAWTPRKGTLTLRNPNSRAQEVVLDIGDAFELPAGAPQRYVACNPFGGTFAKPFAMRTGSYHIFRLEPYEVVNLDVVPVG